MPTVVGSATTGRPSRLPPGRRRPSIGCNPSVLPQTSICRIELWLLLVQQSPPAPPKTLLGACGTRLNRVRQKRKRAQTPPANGGLKPSAWIFSPNGESYKRSGRVRLTPDRHLPQRAALVTARHDRNDLYQKTGGIPPGRCSTMEHRMSNLSRRSLVTSAPTLQALALRAP